MLGAKAAAVSGPCDVATDRAIVCVVDGDPSMRGAWEFHRSASVHHYQPSLAALMTGHGDIPMPVRIMK
jgi:hypothetical protein